MERRRFEGSVKGIAATVTPEITVYRRDSIVGFARSRIRSNLRVYESDYGPLLLAAYLAGIEYPRLAVIVAKDASSLIKAVKHVAENGLKSRRDETWRIETRIADPSTAKAVVERAADIVSGRTKPRPPRTSRICSYCPYREKCVYHAGSHT